MLIINTVGKNVNTCIPFVYIDDPYNSTNNDEIFMAYDHKIGQTVTCRKAQFIICSDSSVVNLKGETVGIIKDNLIVFNDIEHSVQQPPTKAKLRL
jgi:hypothetical protein